MSYTSKPGHSSLTVKLTQESVEEVLDVQGEAQGRLFRRASDTDLLKKKIKLSFIENPPPKEKLVVEDSDSDESCLTLSKSDEEEEVPDSGQNRQKIRLVRLEDSNEGTTDSDDLPLPPMELLEDPRNLRRTQSESAMVVLKRQQVPGSKKLLGRFRKMRKKAKTSAGSLKRPGSSQKRKKSELNPFDLAVGQGQNITQSFKGLEFKFLSTPIPTLKITHDSLYFKPGETFAPFKEFIRSLWQTGGLNTKSFKFKVAGKKQETLREENLARKRVQSPFELLGFIFRQLELDLDLLDALHPFFEDPSENKLEYLVNFEHIDSRIDEIQRELPGDKTHMHADVNDPGQMDLVKEWTKLTELKEIAKQYPDFWLVEKIFTLVSIGAFSKIAPTNPQDNFFGTYLHGKFGTPFFDLADSKWFKFSKGDEMRVNTRFLLKQKKEEQVTLEVTRVIAYASYEHDPKKYDSNDLEQRYHFLPLSLTLEYKIPRYKPGTPQNTPTGSRKKKRTSRAKKSSEGITTSLKASFEKSLLMERAFYHTHKEVFEDLRNLFLLNKFDWNSKKVKQEVYLALSDWRNYVLSPEYSGDLELNLVYLKHLFETPPAWLNPPDEEGHKDKKLSGSSKKKIRDYIATEFPKRMQQKFNADLKVVKEDLKPQGIQIKAQQ